MTPKTLVIGDSLSRVAVDLGLFGMSRCVVGCKVVQLGALLKNVRLGRYEAALFSDVGISQK